MHLSRAAVVSLLLCSGCGQSSSSPAQPQTSSEPYVHRATGFTFPATVGEFTRAQISKYNSEGTDVGVGYNLYTPTKQIAVTVFVYPAPLAVDASAQDKACAAQFESVKADIERGHRDVHQIAESTIPSPAPNFDNAGKKAVYNYEDVFAGTAQPLRSEADLYCYVSGPWFVAYRTTTPKNTDYEPDLRRLMHDLTWPSGSKSAASS